jgi:dTDP-4-amino-4,6-dideoxygalactose transaminase
MRVPLVDLGAQFNFLRPEIMAAIEQVLESSQLFLGPQTHAFEDEFARYCGADFCIGVANGTDALHLALRAAGVGPGDEVITPSHTFIACVEAIDQVGARPVLVDVDPRTFTVGIEQIEPALSSRTRAIIPVHLYGRMADLEPVVALARSRGIVVIEDASQAQGARDRLGRGAGSIGDVGTFSFYYAKNLGAYGEAGAVVTSNPAYAERLRVLRSHGEARRYEHAVLGFNSRIDEIQAAVLRVKLPRLDEWNTARQQHAARYHALLADLPVERPELLLDGSHVYHQFVVRTRNRDALRSALLDAGVQTGVHYPIPIHLQPAAQHLGYARGDLPHTERLVDEIVSLPMYPELSSSQLEYVAEQIQALAGARTSVSKGASPPPGDGTRSVLSTKPSRP